MMTNILIVVLLLLLIASLGYNYFQHKSIKENDLASNEDPKNYKMLSLLMEHSPDVVFSVDKKYNYLAFNNAHAKTMKSVYGCDISVGSNILEYMKVRGDDEVAKVDIQRALNGENFQITRTYGDEDNYQRAHFEATYTPIKAEEKITGVAVVVRNVTDQYVSQENLKRSERKYKQLFHYNYLGALVIKDNTIIDANDTAVIHLGKETHELVGMTLDELFQIGSKNVIKKSKKEFISKYLNKYSKVKYLNVREEVIFDQKEKQNIAFIEDITDKYEAQEELIKVNHQRQVLIESAKSYIFSINSEYELETYNTKFSELIFQLSQVKIRPSINLKNEPYKTAFSMYFEYFEQAFNTGRIVEKDFFLSDDLIIQCAFSPLISESNIVYGVAVYSIDITDEKKHESEISQLNSSLEQKVIERTFELQQQKVKLDLALDAAKIGTWSYVPSEGFYWDNKFVNIFGLQHLVKNDDIKDYLSIVSEHDQEQVVQLIRNVKSETADLINILLTIEHKKYGKQYIQVYGRSTRKLNSTYAMHGVCWNLTRQKSVEIELEKAKVAAERSNKAKSLFLANISHEIRSPLNAIIGFSNILFRKSELQKLPAEFSEQLKYIYFNGEYLSELINNLLDLSRIDAGKMSIYWEEIDLRSLLKMVVKIHEMTAKDRNIKITLNIDTDVPKVFITDPTKLRQILTNLLSNAIKFTKNDTEILVDVFFANQQIILKVSDEGIGIPKDKLNLIFESFEQGDKSVTRKFGGTGLGLAITKKMTEMLNGHINVLSEENKGSTFLITLPINKEQEVIHNEKKGNIEDIDFDYQYTILVVEDNKMNQIMMQALFKQLKLHIEIANNGQEAIDFLKEKSYDLILMDLHMPVMGGISAVQYIRFELENITIPIVALTADAYWDKRFKAFAVGMNDYLTKPISRRQLVNILDKYLVQIKDKGFKYLDPIKNKDIIDELREITVSTMMSDIDKLQRLKSLRNLLQNYDTGFVKYIDYLSEAIATEKEIEVF
ncbi:hybrid sensor histidine kinase/response regulator [Flammeovirga agarivorans]|uniref:histidine kinase n=1 Tax=Flammeovirga agarivorans TaxID=2726742 RepID=A0A7X8SM24_9BACT|nr:ATP-binding protein [Flammeovirga agarivorans]NLR92728.1 response regulator [Flammeovirga agarivorans]